MKANGNRRTAELHAPSDTDFEYKFTLVYWTDVASQFLGPSRHVSIDGWPAVLLPGDLPRGSIWQLWMYIERLKDPLLFIYGEPAD